MATPATVNAWLDELSLSLLTRVSIPKQDQKKFQDSFRRRVRRHTYGRTNQFEVDNKLDGLEEKFQILTLDNLSDALHQRRIDLRDFGHQWLPDLLDLFLHLSADPARNERLLELYRIPPKIGTPPPLRWKDLLVDDPIDRKDLLWKVPDFRDHSDSEYDDEEEISSTQSSPASARKNVPQHEGADGPKADNLFRPASEDYGTVKAAEALKNAAPHAKNTLTELDFVREIIFTLHGLPSCFLPAPGTSVRQEPKVSFPTMSKVVLGSIIDRVMTIRHSVDQLNQWLATGSTCAYIQTMKVSAELIITQFFVGLNEYFERLINPSLVTAVSVTEVVNIAEELSYEVCAISQFLSATRLSDPISCLEDLYTLTCDNQTSGGYREYRALLSLLVPSLREYFEPILMWVEAGQIDTDQPFFMKSRPKSSNLSELWRQNFSIDYTGVHRPPKFIVELLDLISVCGKTAAFLKHLTSGRHVLPRSSSDYHSLRFKLEKLRDERTIPCDAAFKNLCQEHISICLQKHTASLKSMLVGQCGLTRTLDAISQLYLAQDGALLGRIETKIFDKIDKCIDTWNDRFLVGDMIEQALETNENESRANTVAIHSTYTSARLMEDRRRSVKILKALTFEYHLTWPLANVIGPTSMASYQRVSLLLMQIRRARYCLQNRGYISVSTIPLEQNSNAIDQKFAQILAFKLLVFLNTVYNHLTTTAIIPATAAMRDRMTSASTLDAMIEIHLRYVTRLEFSCLASPKLKVVREVLLTLLDMCVRFSDLVSVSSVRNSNEADIEHDSFRSARSRDHKAWNVARAADSEEDSEINDESIVEGYSSFIVLDNDTTIVKELRKLQEQFTRQLDLLVAGLRGAGRASQYGQDLDDLSSQLRCNLRV